MIKKSQKGITLIALVITIIVLLILASVSIAMLTGNNGILQKAETAKESSAEAEGEEKINLAILAVKTQTNGGFDQYLLQKELEKYGLTGTKGENETTVTVNEKTYMIDDEGNVTSKETIKDITAKMVAENPEKYYGLKVTNYTSTNGQDDWRIFYSDGTHIFLITGGYVDLSVENRLDSNTGMTKEGTKYVTYWDPSNIPNLQTVSETVKTRFMATGYTLNSYSINSRCVSTLLNASNWESYKDNNGMAEYAVGGSTIEMWVDSWNKRYPSDKIYCNNTNNTGYYVGTSSNPTSTSIDLSAKEGYNNSLYYPHHTETSDGNNECLYYLLASPSAYMDRLLSSVSCYGSVNDNYLDYGNFVTVLRPVVSLNSEVTVNAIDV